MLKRLHKFLRLPHERQWFLLISFLMLAFVRLGLSTIRYNRLCRIIPHATTNAPPEFLDLLCWCVPRAAKFVWRASCLTQAVAVRLMLARQGYGTEMRIGARRDMQGRFQAHAWLLSNGRVVLGGRQAELDSYATFSTFSPPPS